MSHCTFSTPANCCALLLLAPLVAQTPAVVLEESEIVAGSIVVTALGRAELDDSGHWFASVYLRGIRDPNPSTPGILSEGVIVHPSAPVFLTPYGPHDVGPGGDLLAVGASVLGGVGLHELVWNDKLVAAEGDLAVASGLPAGSTYADFVEQRLDANRSILTRAQLSSGTALLRYRLDPAGTVQTTEALLFQDPRPTAIAQNERGDWMAAVSELALPGGSILLNGAAIARAGSPSPLAGLAYRTLAGARVDVDDLGRTAFGAELEGLAGDSILVRHGAVFARTGEVLPALAPGSLGFLLPTALCLANSGDLYWFADVVGGEDALMRNHEVIARPGVTLVGGRSVSRVDPLFSISPSGRFWCGLVELDGAKDVLLRADFGLAEPIAGCRANAGTLVLAAGNLLAGRTIELSVAGPPTLAGLVRLHFSRTRLANSTGCGLALGPGELLIDPRTSLGTLSGGAFTGAPVRFTLAIPPDPALIDLEFFAQGVFQHTLGSRPRVEFTNGMRFEIGAP